MRTPITEDAKIVCWAAVLACMSPLVVGLVATVSAFASPRFDDQSDKPSDKTDYCVSSDCHAAIIDRKVMHAPAEQHDCGECHSYASPENHLFALTKPRRELCSSCHTLMHDRMVHTPVAEGNCVGCHDPHGSEHPMMLVADLGRELCSTCHEPSLFDKEYIHGPVAIGACIVCHEAHSSGYPGIVTDAPQRLCLGCHSEFKPGDLVARRLHKPFEEGGCVSCHDPHASDIHRQLRTRLPNLCLDCHEGLKDRLDTASIVHGPAKGQGGCVSCHSPHFSSLPRLQKAVQPDLCLRCHDKQIKAEDGRLITNMADLLRDNPDHHGPILQGACTACHEPHASDHYRLLFSEYPAEFYAPFDIERYELCFSCHMSDLVLDESGTGLTGFREGDHNLHWLHVNTEKGRTCRACHEVHGSKRPFHVRESVPYGERGWLLEINFEKTSSGGMCSPACHRTRGYSREPANTESQGTGEDK